MILLFLKYVTIGVTSAKRAILNLKNMFYWLYKVIQII